MKIEKRAEKENKNVFLFVSHWWKRRERNKVAGQGGACDNLKQEEPELKKISVWFSMCQCSLFLSLSLSLPRVFQTFSLSCPAWTKEFVIAFLIKSKSNPIVSQILWLSKSEYQKVNLLFLKGCLCLFLFFLPLHAGRENFSFQEGDEDDDAD